MSQKKPPSPEVRIKFSVDASSKEAAEKLKPEQFIESVKKDSAVITKNVPKNK